jgi:hypothetical protein
VQIYIKIIEEHIILLKNKENAEKRHGSGPSSIS